MDCCTRFAKFLLCLFNFVFFIFGSVLLTLGVWVVVDKYNFLRVTKLDAIIKSTESGGGQEDIVHQFTNPSVLDHTAYILIAIGGFIFIISFLGYCGSLQESRVLLTSYGLFLIIIFILQIAGIICCLVYRRQADDQVRRGLKLSITNSYTTKDYRDPITLTWDLVMSNMECCGVNNYTDFLEAKRFVAASGEEGLGRKVPEACCILQGDLALLRPADDNCIVSPSTANSYLFKGCYDKFLETTSANLNIVFGSLIGLGAVQFVAIVFAFCICKSVGLQEREIYYRYK